MTNIKIKINKKMVKFNIELNEREHFGGKKRKQDTAIFALKGIILVQ